MKALILEDLVDIVPSPIAIADAALTPQTYVFLDLCRKLRDRLHQGVDKLVVVWLNATPPSGIGSRTPFPLVNEPCGSSPNQCRVYVHRHQ